MSSPTPPPSEQQESAPSSSEPTGSTKLTKRAHHTWRGVVVTALLGVLLGTAVVAQVREHGRSGLQNLSQPDLVALLANVNDESTRLSDELEKQRRTKAELRDGGGDAALRDARTRVDQLAVLNGTKPVRGPGITVTITGAGKGVSGANFLDAVEELRDAGAESIDVGGHRVVANTWFADAAGGPGVENHALGANFTITAIGDPHTMSTAMAIPGGVTDTLTQAGAHVKVSQDNALRITSVLANK